MSTTSTGETVTDHLPRSWRSPPGEPAAWRGPDRRATPSRPPAGTFGAVRNDRAETAVRDGPGHPRGALCAAAGLALALSGALAGCASTGTAHRDTRDAPQIVALVGRPAPGSLSLTAVTCPATELCWAVGSAGSPAGPAAAVTATRDGGRTWRLQTAGLPASSVLNAVACWDIRHCMAVGDVVTPQLGAAVVTTADGGRHWRAVTSPPNAITLSAVQCPGAGTCIALASDGSQMWSASTADGGVTWSNGGDLPAGFSGTTSLSCTGAVDCIVAGDISTGPGHAGGAVARTADGGTSWSLASLPSGVGLLHGATCAAQSCMVVGTTSTTTSAVSPGSGVVLASTDGGATFSARTVPQALGDGFSVSCPVPGSCAVVGIHWSDAIPATPLAGAVTTPDLGARFAVPAVRYVPSELLSVSCPSSNACVAAGGDVLATLQLPPTQLGSVPASRRRDPNNGPTATTRPTATTGPTATTRPTTTTTTTTGPTTG